MPIQRTTAGTGLTETEVLRFSGPLTQEEQAEYDELTKLQFIDGRLDHIVERCGEILKAAGLPPVSGSYLYDSLGNWRLSDVLRAGDTWTDQVWSIARQRGHAPDSRIGYAAKMLDGVARIRRRRTAGDQDGALIDAFF